jgi:undecaprenyl-diphosphatase
VPHAGDDVEPELSQRDDRRWGSYTATVLGGWLLLLGLVAGVGALLTGPLADTDPLRWDRQFPVDLERARTATGETWSQIGSAMGETLTVVSVAILVGIVLLIGRRWASVALLATALLVEVSVFVATTILISRDRPEVEQLDASPPTSSFPSGHTAAGTTLALTLAVLVGWNTRSTTLRWLAWALAVLVGPVIAYSRVYRGMHHPTDVIVALVIGVACLTLAFVAVRTWLGPRPESEFIRTSTTVEEKVR